MKSLWENSAQIKKFEELNKNISTDVLIIGGGLAGILCAYMLHNAGVNYVLAEADEIARGVTHNTTAKITSKHNLIYNKIIQEFNVETAKLYLQANEDAISTYRNMCGGIDCDFEEKDNFVYTINNKAKLESELKALKKIGYNAQFTNDSPLPFKTEGAICFKNQAQFNPIKFISNIVEKLNIYEHTPVRELIKTSAITDKGRIKAKKIVVATHFPFINKHGAYFIKMYQQRSYVIALENAPDYKAMYIDEAENGLSFRNYNNLLLLGGGGHRTGKQGGAWKELREFASRNFPKAKEKYYWATQDCITLDGIPYIGRYSANSEGLYVATGFNKWGMTSSMVAAKILTDMLQENHSPYESVFDPSRTILRPTLAKNAIESVVNLITPTVPRCPHLGCALKWNKNERTWDCPCHGSRFQYDGKLINNPATGNMKKYSR